jgi:nucleoside-diphosphate-sugar epimerase
VFDGRSRPRLREADAPYPAKCWRETLEPQSHAERMVRSFNGVNALRTAVIRPAMLFGCAPLYSSVYSSTQADFCAEAPAS